VRRKEAHSISSEGSWSLLTSAATVHDWKLPVNNELDILRKVPGDFSYDISFEKRNQFVPMRRAEHEDVDTQSGREIKNRRGRVFADGIKRDDLHVILPALFQHGVHDLRGLRVVLPTRTLGALQWAWQRDGQFFNEQNVKRALAQVRFFQREP